MPTQCRRGQTFGSLQLPQGTSSLTPNPTSDLSNEKWVTLHEIPTHALPEAFWYVIQDYTTTQHWNRTIYNVSKIAEEWVRNVDGEVVNMKMPSKHTTHPPELRYHALRHLARKTPAPIGGGENGDQPTREAMEWTVQYVENGVEECYDCIDNDSKESPSDPSKSLPYYETKLESATTHIATFGLCIPQIVQTEDNPRAQRYWPFQYPKVRCYRFTYVEIKDDESDSDEITKRTQDTNEDNDKISDTQPPRQGVLRYEVVPLGEDAKTPREFEKLKEHSKNTAVKMLTQLRKRLEKYDAREGRSTYEKRVTHDNLISEEAFRQRYDEMKSKYNFWIDKWTECTDPVKFVYEELSIATYLIVLWEKERKEEDLLKKQTFIDCGCGNGFLVYLLICEGYKGVGVDLQKRNIWDIYPDEVTECLLHEEMDPTKYDCSQYDWILGNHSDELSPWIPVMAARAQPDISERPVCEISGETLAEGKPAETLRRAYPRFFVLPCCFFDFDGKKVSFGRTRRTLGVKAEAGTGKYEQYYRWIARIAKTFGFTVEYENLRIPSTKYVSILGRFIQHEKRISPEVIREMTSLLLLDAQLSHS